MCDVHRRRPTPSVSLLFYHYFARTMDFQFSSSYLFLPSFFLLSCFGLCLRTLRSGHFPASAPPGPPGLLLSSSLLVFLPNLGPVRIPVLTRETLLLFVLSDPWISILTIALVTGSPGCAHSGLGLVRFATIVLLSLLSFVSRVRNCRATSRKCDNQKKNQIGFATASTKWQGMQYVQYEPCTTPAARIDGWGFGKGSEKGGHHGSNIVPISRLERLTSS
ncbi:hypothetical protein C8Q73DRAFT_447222 [Cubamyces lactineus]|nr:hypothetical protein C8Q73DRAFT_447222 [Cubamyces lactineus]